MLIKQLKLRNFGLFSGEHCFNLSPDPNGEKPVVLVRGHNGGGKTTFLEAVRLALYGRRALGTRVSRREYEEYLKRKIHAWTLTDNPSASVELVFLRQENGQRIEYNVSRSWFERGSSITDKTELTRSGALVDDISAEDWDHFLEDMIPCGISQLFFFDGEKIQDVADINSVDGLKDAIASLLGLELVNQLRSDLTVYTTRKNSSTGSTNLEEIEQDLQSARNELDLIEEETARIRSDRNRAAVLKNKAQRAFQNEGGVYAIDRSVLKRTLIEVEKRISLLQTELKHLVDGPLLLGLAPNLVKRLIETVENHRSQEHYDAIRAFLNELAESQVSNQSSEPILTRSQLTEAKRYLEFRTSFNNTVKLDADPSWILGRLTRVTEDLRNEASRLANAFDNAKQHQSLLKTQLKGFDADAAKSALEDLKTAEYRLGSAETRLAGKDRQISNLHKRIDRLEMARTRAINVEFDIRRASHKIELGERIRAALANYETRITQQRIESLSTHFVSCFNGLIRKKNLVHEVQIDPQGFEINLIRADGTHISKDSLSAGERQILAISMLSALGKTSGRQLPIIIDTPLARLDMHHRCAITKSYFPYASQQVILLCSDSELTKDIDRLISPFVSHRYEIGVCKNDYQSSVTTHRASKAYAHQ